MPFDIRIADESIDKLLIYADLLLRWNSKINLTSISTPEEIITRHFGESFLASKILALRGALLDIGSGAGFPGLALKLIEPDLEAVLLEPVGKKRAFLKEVSRACNIRKVEVVGSRLDEFVRHGPGRSFDIITARAVGGLETLIPLASGLLSPAGQLCLWLGTHHALEIRDSCSDYIWQQPVPIPLSQNRAIMVGVQAGI